MWVAWVTGCGGLAPSFTADGTDGPPSPALTPVDSADPEPSTAGTRPAAGHTATPIDADYGPEAWRPGPPPAGPADARSILPLFGGFAGPPKWASADPEAFEGPGWLLLNGRTDPARGGSRFPVDEVVATFHHRNGSDQPLWVHLIATNPNPADVTVSARGRVITDQEEPLAGAGTGAAARVAEAWLRSDLDETAGAIAQGRGLELARAALPPQAWIDGRYEVTADQGVFLYTVVTASGAPSDAINGSQGAPAPGALAVAGPDAYGREAGVYAASGWSGDATFALPPGDGWLAFCFNTDQKFPWAGVVQQDLTADAQMTLVDAAPETWGNRGHHLSLSLAVTNHTGRQRAVTLHLASQAAAAQHGGPFTWNAPVLVDGDVVSAATTPAAPRARLGTRTIEPGETAEISLEAYVPGDVTSGQHLILSVAD